MKQLLTAETLKLVCDMYAMLSREIAQKQLLPFLKELALREFPPPFLTYFPQ